MTHTLYLTASGSEYLVGPKGNILARLSSHGRFFDLRRLDKNPFLVSWIIFNGTPVKVEDPHNLPRGAQIYLGNINLLSEGKLEEILQSPKHCSTPIQTKITLNDHEVLNYVQNYKSN